MSERILCGIALALLLLSGCSFDPDVQLVELSQNTVVYDEIIRINNCGGTGDSEQTKSRDFATNVEFGAGVSAGYQSFAQGSLSAKYSEYRNTSVSQRVVAPPGTNMEFVLRWYEDVRAGNVQVNGKSGTYEVRIPVSVEQVSSRDLGCGVSTMQQPTLTIVATPIVAIQPISTVAPTATPKPISLGKIRIPGNAEEGVRFTANQDGQYIFTYAGGTYSPWPDAQPAEPKWRTSVSVYKNRPIEWVQRPYNPEDDKSIIYKEPSNPDGFIGNYDITTQSESIGIAKAAHSLRFDLRAGDYLIFVVSDDQGWYNNPAPNIGEVLFEVWFIPR